MKDHQLFIHRYSLHPHQSGTLLKVVDVDGHYGVADICPWPKLGDLTLKEELESQGPLFKRALVLAMKDLQARKNKVKLNLNIPVKNHFIVTLDQDLDQLEKYHGHVIKIKASPVKAKNLSEWLNENCKNFSSIRLDFNSSLNADEYTDFVNKLLPEALKKIECVEDPFPFDQTLWQQSSIKIASDFEKNSAWPYRVLKPAREAVGSEFLYLTSSMDHPIGVAHGLIEAQQFPHITHGFLTLDLSVATEFHKHFKQTNEYLSYQSEGYGIGFENEINQISWEPWIDYHKDSDNQIFWGSHFPTQEKEQLLKIKNHFDQHVANNNYFLIPSSGSSHQKNESLKVYAIPKNHFLNAASRVNMEFNLTNEMHWGSVLPTYHVGGLSILARTHLAHSKVFFSTWRNFSTDWIKENNIQLLSLVPTQLYDLVKAKTKCPENVKYVFIGGSHLSSEIEKVATDLRWPLVITYGMTETSAMIASRKTNSDHYIPFQGVSLSVSESSRLRVHSNSLAEYSLQIRDDEVIQKKLIHDGYYETEDIVQLQDQSFCFLQRTGDQIKINGEGVSLFSLRHKLESILSKHDILWNQCALISVPDQRRGEKLVMVFTNESVTKQEVIIESFNNDVRPYERISKSITLQTPFPVTELQKIKYQQLKEMVLEHEKTRS